MSIDKALITRAMQRLRVGDDLSIEHRLISCSACDGHAAAKLKFTEREAAAAGGAEAIASAARAAILQLADQQRVQVHGLVIEVVGEGGNTMARSSSGGPAMSSRPTPAQAAATAGAGGGHRPISGLGAPAIAPSGGGALPGVARAIAVGAGKGGVGKSTVAVNLAVGLARKGHVVGLMDGDIFGPSLPTLLGLHSHQAVVHGGKLQPFLVHGVKAMTIGKLVDPEKALIWRGPMAHGAFKQLTEQTEWGQLDYLIIDLPPGTGDVPLTMAQLIRLTGAVVVCTPQRVAQDDAVRAVRMFQQLGVDVLGVVENMSSFIADDLTPPREYDLFGKGGAEAMAARLGVPFLGALPITIALRENSDAGDPTRNFQGSTRVRERLEALVNAVEAQADLAAVRQGQTRPSLKIT